MTIIVRITCTLAICIFHTQQIYSQGFSPNDVSGIWEVAQKNAHVYIYKHSDKEFRGKLIWIKDSLDKKGNPVLDDKNPDVSKRTQPIKGMVFMTGFSFKSPDKWLDGRIYDAESGNIYTAQITMIDKNTVDLRGYIGIPLFGRSERWRRVK